MLAFGLSILLFVYWAILGLAVLSLLDQRDNPLQTMLLAPVVGVAATLLPVFTLNRIGIPVAHFGIGLAVALGVAAIGVLWRSRPKLVWREYLPFAGIFLLALILTGRPMLQFGFDWASYGNADMTTYYVQSAQRYLHHGFFEAPGADYFSGRDYSFETWSIQIKGHRVGGELLLSWVTSLTWLTPLQVSMPLLLALHMVLVSATGGLIYHAKLAQTAALISCALLSFSALHTLGVVQQLLSQVLGIGLLIGCTTVLLRSFSDLKGWFAVRYSFLSGALTASLFIAYQEVFPFLVAAFLLYVFIGLIRRQLAVKPTLLVLGMTCLVTLVCLRGHFISFLRYAPEAKEVGLMAADPNRIIFPYYLVPSGLSSLWGLMNFSVFLAEPWLSLSIIFGALLLLTVTVLAIRQAWSGQPIGVMTVVMLGLALVLFSHSSEYGLNKLSMFIQPFLMGSLVVGVLSFVQHQAVRLLPLALLALVNFSTQQSYVQISSDSGGGFVELPNASKTKLYSEVKHVINSAQSDHLVVETANTSLSGVLSIYTRGKQTAFISEPSQEYPTLRNRAFDLHDPQSPSAQNPFYLKEEKVALAKSVLGQKDALLISPQPQQELFNRWHHEVGSTTNIDARSLNQVANHLVFNRSQLGPHYFSGTEYRFVAAFYKLEQDLLFKGRTMAALGRHFLFRVLNPSPNARLVLNVSTSLLGDGENQLPPAAAIGTERQKFPILGRGSARVFSPPLTPQQLVDDSYLGIDLGRAGKPLTQPRTGLMNLYGTKIALDPKAVVAFGRDISLISNEEYETLRAPSQLKSFPEDLANKNLEYSGLFEDGWVSEASFFGLSQPKLSSTLRIQGAVPKIEDQAFTTELTIFVDGKKVKTQLLSLGDFDIKLETPNMEKRRRIDLRFSQFQRLPNGDKRPVAAQLKYIGFVSRNS